MNFSRTLLVTACTLLTPPAFSQTAETGSAGESVAATAAEASGETVTELETVTVTGSRYRGEVSSGGARIDVPVEELPLSISVVTEALIDDRQVRNLRDLADNVAGVRSRASGSGAFAIDYTIRGLQGGNVAVNGFRVENFSAGFDPQAVERVEFLKGPASVLYGASGALSGLVNIVTKTPLSEDFLVVDATAGGPGYGRATVDGNIRLSDTLDARTNAALTREEVINAFRDVDAQFVAQSLRWHPDNDLSVLAEGSYFHANGPSRTATQYPSLERFLEIPESLKLGESWDRNINTGRSGRLDASWKLTPTLTLRQGVNYQRYREKDVNVALYTADTFETLIGPDQVGRSLRAGDGTVRYVVSQSEARASFAMGPTLHKLLAGFEYGDEKFGGFCCDGAAIAPLDLNDPVHGAPEPAVTLTEFFQNTIEAQAFYLQDFVEYRRFRLLAGLRHDDTESTSGYCSTLTPGCVEGDPVVRNLGDARKKALSPRVGLAWLPGDATTLFVSWSKSFNPNTSLDRDNRLLPPERGEQYEAGVRQDILPAKQLTASAAVFQITRSNIASTDPLFPDGSRSIAIGQQRVRGAELEVAGKPIDWIDLIASYACLDGEVTESDEASTGILVGSRLPEAAPNSASLFSKFQMTPLGVASLSMTAGIYYVARRPSRTFFDADDSEFSPNLRYLPGSTRVDFGAIWDLSERWRLQANLTNAFDVRVYEPVNVGFNLSQTRRFTMGARLTF